MLAWPRSGFHVHDGVWVAADDRDFTVRLARYCARNPVALGGMEYQEQGGSDRQQWRGHELRSRGGRTSGRWRWFLELIAKMQTRYESARTNSDPPSSRRASGLRDGEPGRAPLSHQGATPCPDPGIDIEKYQKTASMAHPLRVAPRQWARRTHWPSRAGR